MKEVGNDFEISCKICKERAAKKKIT